MEIMEKFKLNDNKELTFGLYQNVKNCVELRKLAISGEYEATLINPCVIVDKFQLLVTSNIAVQHEAQSKMATKNMNSEILYCLSPDRSITGAFKTFGLSDSDTQVIVLLVNNVSDNKVNCNEVFNRVQGELIPISQLSSISNTELIKKVYKITDAELQIGTLLDAVVTRISAKDIL